MDKSRVIMSLAKLAQTVMEKISARIAVSEAAAQTMIEHVGGDPVIIPNGVDMASFAGAVPLSGWPGEGKSLVFLGRVDESRKGLDVLLKAFPLVRREFPEIRLLVAGPGDMDDALAQLSEQDASAITKMGLVGTETKSRVFASGTIYVAPNTGGESFGIVLLEAMASGTPVVASDLDAFKRVLNYGDAGHQFINEDPDSLAQVLIDLLRDDDELARLRQAGLKRANEFDWSTVARDIVEVYESVRVPGVPVEPDLAGQMLGRLGRFRITPEREGEVS
jgi:phosphatidylinositol alpha-mannosyltransferase